MYTEKDKDRQARYRKTNKSKKTRCRWRAANKEYLLEHHRQWTLKLKIAAMEAYGGVKCACCGETRLPFLTLDHIENDGHLDRKQHACHTQFYQWLKKNGYPKEKNLRVMCWNCNCGRRANGGVCPHVMLHERFQPGYQPKPSVSVKSAKSLEAK